MTESGNEFNSNRNSESQLENQRKNNNKICSILDIPHDEPVQMNLLSKTKTSSN